MRIAALYDIHGNLPALEAALGAVHRHGADLLVIGGDVLPGPMPTETLECLRAATVPTACLMGNGDREVLAFRRGETPTTVPARYHAMMRWVGAQLSDEQARWISRWPANVQLRLPTLGTVLFCHATPRSDTELFTSASSDALLQRIFGEESASLFVCGHTHMQFERRAVGAHIINAGSVGMAVGSGGAEWLLIDRAPLLQRTAYDRTAAAERVRATGYPLAEEFATTSLLAPPDPAALLDAYTRAAEP
jgi:predicted phosphodiesterase